MGTPHINANKGDFANIVLMPGDPLRAKWIAETYLHDFKEVTNVRGILGYTGYTKNGKRISVMASGMGQPSIGIYSHELFTYYDVEAIIRVGTCGSYQPNINLFDVLVCTGACTDSNWMSQYHLGGTYSAIADFSLAEEVINVARKHQHPWHAGNILSADVFYDPDKETWTRWAKLGVMGVEMESYALYANAAALNKKSLCLLTVTDNFTKPEEKLTAEQRAYGLGKMIEIAIEAAEKFAK